MILLLNDNIRKYRKSKHMSQDELAEKLNVTRQSISLWETGQTQPSLDNIIALAKLFDISTDTLLTENDSASVETDEGSSKLNKSSKKKKTIIIASACFVIAIALITVAVLFGNDSNNTVNTDTVIPNEEVDPSNETQYDENDKAQTIIEETTTGEDVVESPTSERKEEALSNNNDDEEQTSSEETATGEEISQSNAFSEIESATELPEKQDEKDIYAYLKSFVVEKGILNGDYCYYSKTADNYGGYSSDNFSLYYWGDTDTVEFTLHSVIDDTFSVNFYLLVPKEHTGDYEYISSLYYRDTGEPLYEAKGVITASEFTKNYPLNSAEYIGAADTQSEFMEISRQGICDLIDCLREFISVENLDYSFSDFGFYNY